ncbi:site-2 protease family protein [Carnobacterium inhibens]|uniref:Peptidase M50 domain-containing protein n=1 Tax=Carnobacterium inhibens TaxID=147709 RepID=A0ABR7TDC0_9LACT|nr:site-2 protease family protein [Carnobacterium inhibens]MBC9825702.1 hypothetical protein [Carnobacterium inhibens]
MALNNLSKKKKSKFYNNMLLAGGSIFTGIAIGIFAAVFFPFLNFEINLIVLIGGVLFFFISFFIHILLHETGHLIFGLLTGYTFVSFRIGTLTIIKEKGKLKRKRFHLPGTGGQCLMSPPDYSTDHFPFVLYNLGGVFINLLFSVIPLILTLTIEGLSLPVLSLCLLFAGSALLTALTNGIPMKIGGMPNDGYNLLSILKEEENKKAFFIQLKVNALMTEGSRLKDIPLENIQLKGNPQFSNLLAISVYLLEYNWYLDNLKLGIAKQKLDAFLPHLENLPLFYRNELNCERLFLVLSEQPQNPNLIQEIYDEDLQQFIKKTPYLPSKKRLMMAYEGFYCMNYQKAIDYYEELKKTAPMYPVRGEAEMELMLGEWIKSKLV